MKCFYLFILCALFVSCQNEEFFEQIDDNTSLSSQGELSNLVSRLNQNPTAFDDFIDNSNSLSLELPFEVTINSAITLNITQFTDYQLLINQLSGLPGDYDLSISFPVEVSLPNYESVILQNKAELDAVKASVEGSTEIKCLAYNFPIEINIFETENAVSTRRRIQNEAQFYNLIKGLKQNNGFYEIVYPVSVSIEGDSQVLTSNTDLNTAIQNLDEDCFNPSLLTNKSSRIDQFVAFVTSGEFKITQYTDERGENETAIFKDFRYQFNPNNSISIENVSTSEVFTGDWALEIDDDNNQLVFDLDFEDNEVLDELDEDWKVEGFANPTRIILRDSDNAGENTILIFEKI
ncbi:hypothetical protein G3567_06570 [Psychroflexus sp. YR1-1]|uniref:Lipoprotein n=1 Tax=Psychroflexus aurantiacus TaxID=2709310 RepID=A0A6B3R2U3_9FLAO|nr:hypothetical protein [Psychroflexus aurantiacus]NEV93810.1 hypothetical protein [Psychroflexus aurantiacus]